MIPEQARKRIEREAQKATDRLPDSYFQCKGKYFDGYIASATAECERAQELIKALTEIMQNTTEQSIHSIAEQALKNYNQ